MISVVTPTIPGREQLLAEAVASVEAQTLQPTAHLIELDTSHTGPGPTMNRLVPKVETEWVSILADDDLYDPDHLKTLAAHSKHADIVLSWSRFLGSDRSQYRGEFNIEDLRARKDTGMRGCFMFRKELYDRIGGWPEGLSEDWQFLINAADAGAVIVPVYRETWSYRQHDASTSTAIGQLIRGEEPNQWLHLAKHLNPTSDVTVLIPFYTGHGSREWLQECVTGFPQGTKYLVAENDGDLAGAMNEALALVDTEWVVAFGHDDVPADDMLEQMLSVSSDADVVYPTMILTDEALKPIGAYNADLFCGNRLQTWNFVSGGFLARTEVVRAAGGWRHLETFEDWDLHVRMFRNGARFKACPDARFMYRQHPTSRQRSQTREYPSRAAMRKHWQAEIVGTVPKVEATFYYQATPATAYWRCVVPARHLPGVAMSVAGLEAEQRETGEIDILDQQGAAIFQFGANNELAAAELVIQAAGTRVLIEVDDNYLDDMDVLFRDRSGWAKNIGKDSPFSVQGHRWIAKTADGVIVTTPTLADIYSKVNPNVFVCPNALDLSDWPDYVKPDDGVFRIGWFASRSHDRDAPLVRKALSWASRQPGVEVVTVGLDPAGWNFARHHYPWSNDFTAYRKHLLTFDVGVAPIVRTSSSICRSDLKALEYGVSGALPVLSAEAPYDDWRDKPALFAHTAKDFETQIRWCVRNQDEARRMAREARAHVLNERLIQHKIALWREAVTG